MVAKQMIRINGIEYPSRMTMGAMMEFRRLTGKEVTEMQGSDLSLALTLLYCCVLSASRADGITLPFASAIEMADFMEADDFASWQNNQFSAPVAPAGEAAGNNGKKKG